MENDTTSTTYVFVVIQGCVAYEPVNPVIWTFVSEAAARAKFHEAREVRYVDGPPYEDFYTELHKVPEGEQVCHETEIDSA
jgi:hypothetical protein